MIYFSPLDFIPLVFYFFFCLFLNIIIYFFFTTSLFVVFFVLKLKASKRMTQFLLSAYT